MNQIRLLSRTFFTRMFESDLMPDGLPQVQLILWGALLAATPTTGYPLILKRQPFDSDHIILITLSMVAIGVVGLIIWDGVFPDRRDIRNLGTLPIPTHRFVLARLAALGQVFVLFAGPICVPQALIFGLMVGAYGDVSRIHAVTAHFLTVALACTFVFAALIAAQCLLLVLFGRRAAQAASMTFQILFAVGLVQLLVFIGEIGEMLQPGPHGVGLVSALPQTWFFGFYQTLVGHADTASVLRAEIAIGATILTVLLAMGLYMSSYSALCRRALEGPPATSRRLWAFVPRFQRTTRHGFNSPMRRAIRQFAINTLFRSRSHRMMLSIYAGVALAIVISSAASIAVRNNGAALWVPSPPMLSLPLVIQFLLLVGLRVIISVPSEPKARWAFRACEPMDRGEAVTAARDTMLVVIVWPTVALAFLQGVIFWSPWLALLHATFDLVVGTAFAELLIARTTKLPFACSYFPGKSRVFTLWPFYIMFFFYYSVFLAVVESVLLRRPSRFAVFCGITLLITWGLASYRRRTLAQQPGLLFDEEDPDAIFQGFQLSEGLAAAPKPAGKR